MYHPKHRVSRGVLFLCTLALVPACDSDSSGPEPEAPFEPVAAAEAVAAIGDVLAANYLEDYLGQVAIVLGSVEYQTGARRLGALVGHPLAPTALAASIPADFRGRTLVWDAFALEYVVDPDRTGAPVEGVRFIAYVMDEGNHTPVLPLEEVGYIDLVVETEDDMSVVLELTYWSTTGPVPVTLALYTVGFSITEQAEAIGLAFGASGFVSDGTDKVDFLVSHVFAFPATGETGNFTQLIEFEVDGGGPSFEQVVTLEFDESFSSIGEAAYTVGITNGGETLAFDLVVSEEDRIQGTIEVDDEVVLHVSGDFLTPAFRLPDGATAPAVTRSAMAKLWTDTILLTDSAARLLLPADAGATTL